MKKNASKQIFELLNRGDYELALKRCEVFKGQNLFVLLILMIHELTVGTSMNSDFKVDACKAVLNKISITSFNLIRGVKKGDTISSCISNLSIYKYHLEIQKMGLNDNSLLDKLSFNSEFIINVLHYDFLAEDTLNELIKNRCRNKTDIIPIYAKLYETYHLKNSHKLAFKYFDKLIDEINNLKIEDKIQFKYMDTPMGHLQLKLDYYQYLFAWNKYISSKCYKQHDQSRLKLVYNSMINNYNEFKTLISNDLELIEVDGSGSSFQTEQFNQAQRLVEIQLKISESDNKFYKLSKELDDNFQNEYESADKSELFGNVYKKYNYEIGFGKSLINQTKLKEYYDFLDSIENLNLKGCLVIEVCKEFYSESNFNLTQHIEILHNILDVMEFGEEVFNLSENCFQFFFQKGYVEIGEGFLNKSIDLTQSLSNKSQRFYCDRISKIIVGFCFLNNIEELTKYFQIYADTWFSIEEDESKLSKSIVWPIFYSLSKCHNLNSIMKIKELLESCEYVKEDDFGKKIHKIICDLMFKSVSKDELINYCIINDYFPHFDDNDYMSWETNDYESYGETPLMMNGKYRSYANPYNHYTYDLNTLTEIMNNLNSPNINQGTYTYFLDLLSHDNNYDKLFEIALENFTSSFLRIEYQNDALTKRQFGPNYNMYTNQVKNSYICYKILENTKIEKGLDIINHFNFDENIYVHYTKERSFGMYNNVKVNYLINNLNKKNASKIFKLIENEINSQTNKLLGFSFLANKLKELGYDKLAIKAYDYWIDYSSKKNYV